jgi:hypothetical protein
MSDDDMINISAPPTLTERLRNVPNGRLATRLSLAMTAAESAQLPEQRAKAATESRAIKAEMIRRGLAVTAV